MSLLQSRLLLTTVLFFAGATREVGAQDRAATARAARATLSGTVITEDGAPIPGAYIAIPALERVATADAVGRYRLRDLPTTAVTVVVRSVGRQPLSARRVLTAGENALDVTLRAATVTLVPVVVTGAAAASDPATPLDVAAVDSDKLRETLSASLGKTLEKVPGIATITTGPMAGKMP